MDVKLVVIVLFFCDFYDILKNRIRVLEVFGEILKNYGCILLLIFEFKLFFVILEKWELELVDILDDEIDFELFFKFFN